MEAEQLGPTRLSRHELRSTTTARVAPAPRLGHGGATRKLDAGDCSVAVHASDLSARPPWAPPWLSRGLANVSSTARLVARHRPAFRSPSMSRPAARKTRRLEPWRLQGQPSHRRAGSATRRTRAVSEGSPRPTTSARSISAFRTHGTEPDAAAVGDDWGVRWLTTYVAAVSGRDRDGGCRPPPSPPSPSPALCRRPRTHSADPMRRATFDALTRSSPRRFLVAGLLIRAWRRTAAVLVPRLVSTRSADVGTALPERLDGSTPPPRWVRGSWSATPRSPPLRASIAILLPQPEVTLSIFCRRPTPRYAFGLAPTASCWAARGSAARRTVAVDPAAIARIVQRHRRFTAGSTGCAVRVP